MTLSAVLSVGSTEYSRLVLAALSEDGLGALAAAGVTRLFAQVGHSELPPHIPANETHERSFAQNSSMTIESICFDPDLDIRLAAADLVIAHAGAGTVLAAMQLGTTSQKAKHLILVPNSSLMGDHQAELALQLKELYGVVVSSPDTLLSDIRSFALPKGHDTAQQPSRTSNTSPGSTAFPTYLDSVMGFSAGPKSST